MKGFSLYYIPPEKIEQDKYNNIKIDGEKYDIFALGLTLLQDYLSLANSSIIGANYPEKGEAILKQFLDQIEDIKVKKILTGMLEFDP